MRVCMVPNLGHFRSEESGIKRVVEAYYKYLPRYGVELVDEDQPRDLKAVHAGREPGCDVAHNHGLYWSADYNASAWEWAVNGHVVHSLRSAKAIIVPSQWVAETIRRDMRRVPFVIGHGIDWEDWQHKERPGGHILWNKNRMSDVCDPTPAILLAKVMPRTQFVTTYAIPGRPNNVRVTGLIPHPEMKQLIQSAAVYLATVKETFGIGILEAMASGVPVLGYAHGGIVDLVEHGVNGYLARPGDIQDLTAGAKYCIENRGTLGENGREMARAYKWDRICEQVARVYEQAMVRQPPTVAVIIPSYNYADKVGRAIESALRQTYNNDLTDVVVVDDGSTDGGETERTVSGWTEHDSRVRYIRQSNAGVAAARNLGIASVDAKYVCCLDADDAIAPTFLDVCVRELEADRSLGIAYTGLHFTKPDGSEGVSRWPGEWDFDEQLRRKNQIPTCCVFRRDMWAALYGYRSRYCPEGAGSEDAEFWTRCGAYGWSAARVTREPLFLYSWQSGRVSGDPEYAEVDWLYWHPWAKDGLHPFASYARPRRWSHPVRQYDEPTVSVVIPVGPYHGAKQLINALDSLDAQTFRKWEGIVVWDQEGSVPEDLVRAFPHIGFIEPDRHLGAGAARNLGAELARGPFLVFLDADDWLYPEFLEKVVGEWERKEACVYTDYVGKAFVSDVSKLAPDLQRRILWRNEEDGETVMEYHASEYDWERAQRQPESPRPWTWNTITTLVPKLWHDEIGGFDEEMVSWEDVDYWYRLAMAGKPFVRIPEPLMVYVIWAGKRRDEGREIYADLLAYMQDKYRRIEKQMCSGCGKSSSARRVAPTPQVAAAQTAAILSDGDFVMCRYVHPSRGQRMVYGQATFERRIPGLHMVKARGRPGYLIAYGYRDQGDVFLVHKRDIEISPHIYSPVETKQIPRPAPEPPPPPVPLDDGITIGGPPPPDHAPDGGTPWKVIDLDGGGTGNVRPGVTMAQTAKVDLRALPGVTPQIAAQLEADDIQTRADILALGVDGLQGYKGVGPTKAQMILGALESLVVLEDISE